MVPGIFKLVSQSLKFYKKPVLYQILIIALLSSVITGSLFTGSSVKASLKKSAFERLGNTGIIISSGVRYFDPSLPERLKESISTNCTGILEINGYCQAMSSQKGAFNTKIYGVNHDFFTFQGNDSINIKPGEVAVNKRLAEFLGVKPGDELIVRFNLMSEIPADAPFAPAKEPGISTVMKIGCILEADKTGNFSLSISQIMPMNIFIHLSDIENITGKTAKINRLLIEKNDLYSLKEAYTRLRDNLKPSDIGLSLRLVKKTGEWELVSDRIFIDASIISEVQKVLPTSAPVLTYLGNRLKAGTRTTPYSFVSALPSSLYPEIVRDNGIIVNRWLADDLLVNAGDTIEMFWYSPDSLNKLIEDKHKFVIKRIVDMQGIWSDTLLMPDFPGISGSKTCSGWDAGVPIRMDEIRGKDEEYWNKFKGTPKAFISYETGKEIWGNNFGPATSLRFPEEVSEEEIKSKLEGSFDPDKSGFSITDLYTESVKAANESVDFSTLFLSLGFFLILASIVLLSFAVTAYFDTKKGQIQVLFALGFKNRLIGQILFTESVIISITGCFIGALAGFLVNILITGALNSVWRGAVQTDTLTTFFNPAPLLTGFIITLLTAMIFMWLKIKRYIKTLNRREKEVHLNHSPGKNFILLLILLCILIILSSLSVYLKDQEVSLSFAAGTILLITMVVFWRQFFVGWNIRKDTKTKIRKNLSRLYYSFYPSHAVTPVLFIAAGIFAVFITGANRMNFSGEQMKRTGGTGGYLLWCDNTIPVREDLNSISGRKSTGIDDEQLKDMRFVQAKRSSGDDASCLNLNHVSAPPILGIDPSDFIAKGSFSFSKALIQKNFENPWHYLKETSDNNIIYGIADQTVLQWGLKIKTGDTLILRTENGQPLKIIIAAGLKSSVFQGYVLIGIENFTKYYPSVSGFSVLLVDGDPRLTGFYKTTLNERLESYGLKIEQTGDRLAAFYEVTNTYLSVFGVFGAFGMIIGSAGLGFILLRNYNNRKKEFALMLATGFHIRKIRRIVLYEQLLILFAGVTSGVFSALVATFPSIKNSSDIPWLFLTFMVLAIIATGLAALNFSVRAIRKDSLTSILRKE
jgi:putative ABC transport system permease protein